MRRENPCRKIPHATMESAQDHIRALELANANRPARPGKRLAAYWCDVHTCFHVGHRSDDDRSDVLAEEKAQAVAEDGRLGPEPPCLGDSPHEHSIDVR